MGKLDTFLRKEVRKTRVKPPREDPRRTPTPPPFTSITDRRESENRLSINNDNALFSGLQARDEVDSVFGEHVPTKEEIQQAKLERFLAQNPPTIQEKPAFVSRQQKDIDAKIEFLKDELKALTTLANESNMQERSLIQRQRKALQQEIRYLEVEARVGKLGEQNRTMRAELKEELERLPEPLSAAEKRQIERMKARREKERLEAGKPKPKPKRKKSEYNSDDDLDGEERLRYGKSLKKKPVEVTGRWNSVIHDYFPGGDAESEEIANMSGAEKALYRRELAELGEQLALAERRKRRGVRY
ncbi:uncharacterized protein BP5553_08006 [Venustampulla echinocandica]|uniref:Uncharacterized protein n=1 Tax=Venustampulla echinocandica TaxID=2656787 RepID=A0A370TFG4_9HELO|nr:uncharacterized protein BP5553_08006 [Venustampulla echinocandica]RDL33638.1 hypothetical protein BP5553_08006 [Venustampulla echinocandica]